MTATAFSSLALPSGLVDNLSTLGYTQMTPVQAQSLPPVLSGKDIIAQAKTGSGKTAAFSLGVLAKLNVKRFRIQALVLCPTRELADQVAVGAVDLDPVEASPFRSLGGVHVVLHDPGDLRGLECPRRFMGLLALRGVDTFALDGDGGRSDRKVTEGPS